MFGGLLDKRFTSLRHIPRRFNKSEGVYILSPRSNPSVELNSRIKVKIGCSSNIYSRLDQYHTYYADSFYTYSCILTKNGKYKIIEKAIHKALKQKNKDYLYTHPKYQARMEGEWFFARKYMFIDVINTIIEEYQDDIEMIWNDQENFTLIKPAGNDYIKVHNPKPLAKRPPRVIDLTKKTKHGYAIDDDDNYVTVEKADDDSWKTDWNTADLTLNRADRRQRRVVL